MMVKMKTAPQHFTARIKIRGINPYVHVEEKIAKAIAHDWKKPMPVLLSINDRQTEPWHVNLMPVGDGSFYLYLHGDIRKASGTQAGDMVSIELQFDADYTNGPMHPMPEWFRDPLSRNAKAQKAWDELPPSRQKEILRYFSRLKSDEAKMRNIDKALRALSGHAERFMARTWKNGK